MTVGSGKKLVNLGLPKMQFLDQTKNYFGLEGGKTERKAGV